MNGFVPQSYSHVGMMNDFLRHVKSPKNTYIDQHFLYIDSLSAVDWVTFCSRDDYQKSINRHDIHSLDWAAKVVTRYLTHSKFKRDRLDVVSLGPGDGKTEEVFLRALLEHLHFEELQCYLFDISPSLAIEAENYIAQAFHYNPHVIPKFVLGDFMELNEHPTIFADAEREDVLRLVCMLGGTFGNLSRDMHFIRHGLSALKSGDLFLVQVFLGSAPSDCLDRIREEDPIFRFFDQDRKGRSAIESWVGGPILRNREGLKTLHFDYRLRQNASSNIAGTYTITMQAVIDETLDFTVLEMHRYNMDHFIRTFADEGFCPIGGRQYGYHNNRLAYLFSKI